MILPCKDGKRHWWRDGWVCTKCGLRRADYDDEVKEIKKIKMIDKRVDEECAVACENSRKDCIAAEALESPPAVDPNLACGLNGRGKWVFGEEAMKNCGMNKEAR